MALKDCIVCSASFSALGNAKTCSPECSKQHTRNYNATYWQEHRPDPHARKVERELATTLRLVARLEREEPKTCEYARRWRAENRERTNEYKREWAKKNRDRTRNYTRRYRAKNPDKVKQWSVAYETANRERRNEMQRRRKAARRANR